MDAFIGTIMPWPVYYAPEGWAFCWGQELPVAQYQALFALLGTTYGGDGRTTFKLPDLRGRVPIGAGQGPGLLYRRLGTMYGSESVSLEWNQIPAHNHSIPASTAGGNTQNPSPNVCLAKSQDTRGMEMDIYTSKNSETTIKPTEFTGGSQSHDNMPPFTVLNYIICLNGLWPTRP